jgi:cell pole-organizing protein PopZ
VGDSNTTKLANVSDGILTAKTSEAMVAPKTRGLTSSANPNSAAAEATENNAKAEVLNGTKVVTGAAEKRSKTGDVREVTDVSAVVGELAATSGVPSQTLQPRTLEDTVVDLLRPMLKQWLDSNMPRIVEKALRVELAHEAKKTPA